MIPPDKNKLFATNASLLNQQKFIVISRKDNQSFENVNPFIIKKAIHFICAGEVLSCKKTRAGTLLVQTKHIIQATKLLKLNKIGDIEVIATEHKTLNSSKGVIYCNQLRNISEEEILKELRSQKVIDVYKWKKIEADKTETLMGLITLTFDSVTLPEKVMIGYEVVFTRPYIPKPRRCNKCLRYGHPTPICRQENFICNNCS